MLWVKCSFGLHGCCWKQKGGKHEHLRGARPDLILIAHHEASVGHVSQSFVCMFIINVSLGVEILLWVKCSFGLHVCCWKQKGGKHEHPTMEASVGHVAQVSCVCLSSMFLYVLKFGCG